MDKNLLIAKYRWEFLRRDEQYRKDWTSFFVNPKTDLAKQLLEKWKPWNFPQSKNMDKEWDDIERILGTIWSKELENESFWPMLMDLIIAGQWKYIGKKPHYNITPELLCDPNHSGNLIVSIEEIKTGEYYLRSDSGPITLSKNKLPNEINIRITNFKAYLKASSVKQHAFRESLKHVVNQQLRLWEYASDKLDVSEKMTKRFRFDDYDQHLKVWDLVKKKGKRWTEIARIIFPDNADHESARNTVKNSYKEACRLIEGGKDFFVEF